MSRVMTVCGNTRSSSSLGVAARGAYGVIRPMINTSEDAQQLVAYTHHAPQGTRSFGPSAPRHTLAPAMPSTPTGPS